MPNELSRCASAGFSHTPAAATCHYASEANISLLPPAIFSPASALILSFRLHLAFHCHFFRHTPYRDFADGFSLFHTMLAGFLSFRMLKETCRAAFDARCRAAVFAFARRLVIVLADYFFADK